MQAPLLTKPPPPPSSGSPWRSHQRRLKLEDRDIDSNITFPVIYYGEEQNLDVELDLCTHSNNEAESSITDADDNIHHEDSLVEHQEYFGCLWKKNWEGTSRGELIAYAEKVLTPIPCLRLNSYKMVEMWKNYHSIISVFC